jgi:hypothetical protein
MSIDATRWLDVLALWIICWCAFSALVAAHEVRDWKSLTVSLGLIGTVMCSFAGAVSVAAHAYRPTWWVSGLIVSVAILAARWYDQRFGIAAQLRRVADSLLRRCRRIARWIRQVSS